MQTVGNLFLWLALIIAVVSVGSLLWGRRMKGSEGESLINTGYLATYGVFASLTASVAILLSAFFRLDFAFQYVAENHSTDVSGLAWLYKISGVWAGREGSLLFWAWLVAMFGAYVVYRRIQETDDLSNASLAVFNIVQVFFIVSLLIQTNNPFKTSPATWLGPDGELLIAAAMNPLLQHWAMILHPPTLFVGYAGLAVPFAFAIGALISGDASKRWVTYIDRITVFSWLFLGIGIGLGAIWAYVVLGWGGFWAWDPVENASLLPWLTGVGLLHSFTVYRRRGAFKKWAVVMATATFILVILGTFITRSGVIQSVHAFQEDPISLAIFLTMMILAALAAAVGLFVRSKEFQGADEFESLTSKESSYYFNNVLMLVAAIVIAGLTMSPAFGGKSYGPATYDAIARPVGILYVFIMAVCPLLSWRKTEGPLFWKRVKVPMIGTVGLFALFTAIWWIELWPKYEAMNPGANPATSIVHTYEALIAMFVAALAISIAVHLFIEGARRRSAAKGEGFFSALGNIIFKARTQSGGYITHLGIGIILFGLVGSTMFVQETITSVPNQPGAQFSVGDYTFTYQGFNEVQLPNSDVEGTVTFDVAKNGNVIGQASPGQVSFFRQQQTKLNASVVVEPLHDVFVVFQGIDPETDLISMQVKINPLISWAWVGFVITIIGTAIAMYPKRQLAAA